MYRDFNWSLASTMSKNGTISPPIDEAEEATLLDARSPEKLTMSSRAQSLKYEEEWESLARDDIDLRALRKRALEGGLRASRFRSVAWRLLLTALSPGERPEIWASEASRYRRHYSELVERLRVTPNDGGGGREDQAADDNPLSQSEQSTWHQYFCDRDLRSLIRQDVVRTFPGVDFFRSDSVQEVMINVLFAYARENPAMCYRQGMHEVLAPVIFVVHCDQQALLHTQENSSLGEDIIQVLNPEYLEADSYILFRRIMNAIEGSYLIPNMAPTSTGYFPANTQTCMNNSENQVVAQLNWIKDRLLSAHDPQLFQHLERLDIPLQLFGIRWLRLLFGREFPLQDLLVLWDAIFADSSSFDLVNYIVVSMLIAIRSSLLRSDYTSCLTQLMRYPPAVDVSIIIEYALHLKSPEKYSAPAKIVPPKYTGIEGENVSKTNSRKKQNTGKRHPKYAVTDRVFVKIPSRSSGDGIIDGYKMPDGELMTELMNAYTVMSLCRLKLSQYHSVLEGALSPGNTEAQQALVGIHELCSLLDVQHRLVRRVERVERGTEAEESPSGAAGAPQQQRRIERKPSLDMTVFKEIVTPIREQPPPPPEPS